MGGSPSKMPPIRQRDPLPDSGSISGFSPGDAQGCKQCILTVARGISASGARLYREQGTISLRECEQLKIDTKRVNDKQMAFAQFKSKLLGGKYFNEQGNGFCSQIMFRNEDLQSVNDINQVPWSKALVPSIRKLTTGGGFSSITKLFIKPAIPFSVSFNNESIQVSTMTLFHPCPIRIENVQYDAVLTLGDVADESTKTVLLVPITGSLSPGQSGSFFSKIASFIPGLLMPDPATGQYEPIDVPTGRDWDLSKIFPGSPQGNATVVDSPYYVWNATPQLEMYLKGVVQNPSWLPNIEQYGWRPTSNAALRKFIMLAKPISINTFDLQTIRMLPATPSDEAIPPPLMKSLVFKPAQKCDAGKESFTLEGEDSCDPFAQIKPPSSGITTDTIMAILLGVVTAIAVVIGIYFGMKYAAQPIGTKLKDWGESFGKMMAQASRKVEVKELTPIVPTGEFQMENPTYKRPKKTGTPKSEPTLEVEDQQAKKEAKAKQEAEAKAKQEAKEQEEAAKKLFDEEQAKKKALEEKMKDTSLPEAEQKRVRKEYQKITGEYHPTKQEQEAASGTGLVDEAAAEKLFEEEQARIKAEEEAAASKRKAEEAAAEKLIKEEQARIKAEEEAAAAEKLIKEAKAKEEASKPKVVKKRIIAPEEPDEEEARKLFEEEEAKRKLEYAKKKAEEAKIRVAQRPKLPPHLRPKTIGTTNLGLREDTAKLPGSEAKPPPIPPRENPLFARVQKLKEKNEELKEKQKTQVELAREKFEKAKTETQEEKMKKQLANLKEKQTIEKEKASRELEEAQSKLRQSLSQYRRGQQGRNIYTGRSRHKTARN